MSVGLAVSLMMVVLALVSGTLTWRSTLHQGSLWGVRSPETLRGAASWHAGQEAAARVRLRLAAALALVAGILVLTVGVRTSSLWNAAPAVLALVLGLGGRLARERAAWAADLVASAPAVDARA